MKGFITVSDGLSDHLISTAHIVAVNGKEIVLEGGIAILTDEDFETICKKIGADALQVSTDAKHVTSELYDIGDEIREALERINDKIMTLCRK